MDNTLSGTTGFGLSSTLSSTCAADRLNIPDKQTLVDVEAEISKKLEEIEQLENELESEVILESSVKILKSQDAETAAGDDTESLVSIGVRTDDVPAIRRLKKRSEDPRWRQLQQFEDPTERCRQLLIESVMPKVPLQETVWPKMPTLKITDPPELSHDPLEWSLLRSAEGL